MRWFGSPRIAAAGSEPMSTNIRTCAPRARQVIIDGLCASACTIVLGAVPHDKICVTSHANLGFHAAWDFGANGRAITNPEATQMLYSMYPSAVRHWISARGGLTPHMIFLRGKQLTEHVQALLSRR